MATYANPVPQGYDPNFGNQGFAAPGAQQGFGNQGFAAPTYGNPGAQPFQVQQGYDSSAHRMDWRNPQPVAAWSGMKPERQERKMRELSAGGEVADANPILPDSRPCRDVIFAVLFLVVFAGCVGFGAMNMDVVTELLTQLEAPDIALLGGAMAAGSGCAFFAAFVYMFMMGRAPACVVWTSLIMGPVICIVLGLYMVLYSSTLLIMGAIMAAMGLCMLACVLICWRAFIPFTIEVVKVLSAVMLENPGMMLVAAASGVFSMAWSLGVLFTALAVAADYGQSTGGEIDENLVQLVSIPFVLVYFWGVYVSYYYCHCVLCGVFGRWYYKKDAAAPVCASFKAASTTSFGTVSLAALIIALIRTLEFVIRQMRQDAEEEGNIVMCVVLCILECIVSCIGDIMEWFSEWAFVQVAVRGVGFIDAAKITYTMATASNVDVIIADLLVDSVATLAALVCAGAGAAGGAALMAFSGMPYAGAGAVLGLLPGFMLGNAAGSLVTSGSKTILMSWAENPDTLSQLYPSIAQEWEKKAGPFAS